MFKVSVLGLSVWMPGSNNEFKYPDVPSSLCESISCFICYRKLPVLSGAVHLDWSSCTFLTVVVPFVYQVCAIIYVTVGWCVMVVGTDLWLTGWHSLQQIVMVQIIYSSQESAYSGLRRTIGNTILLHNRSMLWICTTSLERCFLQLAILPCSCQVSTKCESSNHWH